MSDSVAQGAEVLLERVLRGLGERVLSSHCQHGDATIVVAGADRLEAARWLRQELDLDMLMDSTVVDWPDDELRFEVVDHLFSTTEHYRIRLKCRCPEDAPSVPSLVPLWGAATWLEREAFDLYGVTFEGHPDLRRILLYPEFQGHPLRKDYDKLQAWPLFEERYPGIRETQTVIHPNPGDQEPMHEP